MATRDELPWPAGPPLLQVIQWRAGGRAGGLTLTRGSGVSVTGPRPRTDSGDPYDGHRPARLHPGGPTRLGSRRPSRTRALHPVPDPAGRTRTQPGTGAQPALPGLPRPANAHRRPDEGPSVVVPGPRGRPLRPGHRRGGRRAGERAAEARRHRRAPGRLARPRAAARRRSRSRRRRPAHAGRTPGPGSCPVRSADPVGQGPPRRHRPRHGGGRRRRHPRRADRPPTGRHHGDRHHPFAAQGRPARTGAGLRPRPAGGSRTAAVRRAVGGGGPRRSGRGPGHGRRGSN